MYGTIRRIILLWIIDLDHGSCKNGRFKRRKEQLAIACKGEHRIAGEKEERIELTARCRSLFAV